MASLTEKYRPKTLDSVRGNDKAISTFLKWASNWNSQSSAVVLHGSPGVGKTSAAHALASDMGWDVIELNASDQRTAKIINRIARNAANTGTISGGSSGRKLVILDEADNLHGTYDRGGAAALTKLIKEASKIFFSFARKVIRKPLYLSFQKGEACHVMLVVFQVSYRHPYRVIYV